MTRSAAREFTARGARSASLTIAIAGVLLIEGTVMHLWLAPSHPVVAWTLTVTTLASIVWLLRDHRALARPVAVWRDAALELHVGGRVTATIPRTRIAAVRKPDWRALPARGVRDHLDATRPAEPNVLIELREPHSVRVFGIARQVRTMAFRLDDPEAFVAAAAPEGSASATENAHARVSDS